MAKKNNTPWLIGGIAAAGILGYLLATKGKAVQSIVSAATTSAGANNADTAQAATMDYKALTLDQKRAIMWQWLQSNHAGIRNNNLGTLTAQMFGWDATAPNGNYLPDIFEMYYPELIGKSTAAEINFINPLLQQHGLSTISRENATGFAGIIQSVAKIQDTLASIAAPFVPGGQQLLNAQQSLLKGLTGKK